MISARTPFVVGTTTRPDGATASSVDYRDLGMSLDYRLIRGENDDMAFASLGFAIKEVADGVETDGLKQPAIVNRRANAQLRLEKGVPALFTSEESDGGKPPVSPTVFVRADR